ncbi:LOW QUALITY PROTEIN: hypothetical protein SETIT_7G318500v2 [Setaria italica]|uniref:Uncharacterized protein n=1 Tax=Setaria italica TaxID=4555 RepID=A0A368S1T2_SETIT|nr:LOW QUALITY PROTEIN: hypothetical protein SETIT_7G318500v2 [Setaria italica]
MGRHPAGRQCCDDALARLLAQVEKGTGTERHTVHLLAAPPRRHCHRHRLLGFLRWGGNTSATPSLILDLDPEATARPLARSASSTAPAASKQPPPRAPRSAGRRSTRTLASWRRRTALPPHRAPRLRRALARSTSTASTLHRVTGGAPLPPPTTPRSDGRQLPHQEVAEDATKQAAPSPCPAPSSRLPFGFACLRQYATTPTYYAPVTPALLYASRASLLFPRPYVPASTTVLPTMPGMQPQQQTRATAEAVLALGFRDRHAQNPRKLVAGWHISNPTEHDITGSLAGFSTTKSDELDVIRDVLMVLPNAPRSILDCNDQSLGEGDPDGDGTNTSTLIHTKRGSTGSTASEVTTHDISIELTRFDFIRSCQLKIIWEQNLLILYDAAIAPRSILDCNHQSLGGGDLGGDGTKTSTLIHTKRGSTGSTASEVTTHDISIELRRFGFIRSCQLKTIWEKDLLILYDAAIVCAAKAIRVKHDITGSLAGFSTTKSDELDVIRDVLMVLPNAPRSILDCNDQSLGEGDPDGDGTNTSTLIHTKRGSTGSTASEVTTHDISIELTRFDFIRSCQLKIIWENDLLILYDAAIVCAAKANRVRVDMMKMITSILQNHSGAMKYFRIDSS